MTIKPSTQSGWLIRQPEFVLGSYSVTTQATSS